jgi:hypothetical protein
MDPFATYQAELEAAQMLQGTEIKPSDQYDDTRIASALPYADILITDGVKTSTIRELKLDQKNNTRVCSVKRYDVIAALAVACPACADVLDRRPAGVGIGRAASVVTRCLRMFSSTITH